MRFRTCMTLSCLVACAGLALAGCVKKANQSPSAPKTGAAQSPAAPGTSPEVSAKVTADLEKPVPEVQTQAQTMSAPDLKSIAVQYQEAISAKRAELQKVVDQVKEIPIAEALGEKAKALKTEVQKTESTIKALTERFQVYYSQRKEKGADLSGLTI